MRRYPEYKDSGVEWIGKIPRDWVRTRIKFLSRGDKQSFVDGDWVELPYITDDGIRLIQTGNVGVGKYREKGFRYIDESTLTELNCTEIFPKDILICRLAAPVGRACLVPNLGKRMITAVDNCILKPSKSNDNRFIVYQLSSQYYLNYVECISRGGTRGRISRSMLGDIKFVTPNLEEQQSIANYLDRKTNQLEALIENKQKQIDLLKEHRTAIINHAVTKGLNSSVKMKDSGIEWIGDRPEHWKVLMIKRLTSVKRGASPRPIDDPKYFDDNGEFAWVRIADVTASERYLERTTQTLSELGSSLSVKRYPDDFFVSIAGSVGKPIITKIKCCIHDGFVWFPHLSINSEFLYYMFSAGELYKGLGKWGTQLNLNTETIGSIHIPLPSDNEIDKIVNYLDHKTNQIDTLIEIKQKQIELIQEQRTALISSVVTGKIDVRDEIPS